MSILFAAADPKLLSGFRAPIAGGVLALVIAWLLTPFVVKFATKYGAVDDPTRDDRRVHTEPTPRWGGLAIYAGILIALAVILPIAYPHESFPPYLIGLLLLGAFLTIMGAVDDKVSLSASKQLLVLMIAGVGIQFFGQAPNRVQVGSLGIPFTHDFIRLGLWSIPLTAFYIFVVAKTTDTIDGIDGLTAGIAAISSATLTVIAVYSGQPRVAIVTGTVCGASLGFLRHNYNPARIFMGTGGAQLLGFMLASLSVIGAMKTAAAFAVLVPMLAFGVPIFDAAFVVIKRLRSGVPITQADKRHLHHTLLGHGLTQRQAVLVLYTLAATLCAVLLFVIVGRHG
ncbi:MAG: undecaprenyl/decaprenyl-phosphate alpha-N-acetylglucosaminyl 1-phosphate transferase [Armatimonadetes bacterium]|nr:undecaprenyl/decaprenyl-phosphate alpha-N-acetylglucosaminyl 1-phosphate transferase [Armatimonadota bacterium]